MISEQDTGFPMKYHMENYSERSDCHKPGTLVPHTDKHTLKCL